MAEAAPQLLKDILIVDDDNNILQYLSNLLGKYYHVKTAGTGEAALELLQKGYRPIVILSNQQMPGMSGAQLLAESIKIIPESIRVLLTSFTEPKDIVPGMNLGKAYIFIKKPADDLAIIQSIRNGINFYESQQKIKGLQKNLNLVLGELKKLKSEPPKPQENNAEKTIALIYELIAISEQYYFSYHTQNVVNIVKTISEEMHLSDKSRNALETAAKIHMIIYLAMPDRFKLRDPHDLEEDEVEEYFSYFRKPLSQLRNHKEFEAPVKIIEQIWERADGTGYPSTITKDELNIESQILSLANFYDNKAYRLPLNKVEELMAGKELVQTQVETVERHNESLKFIYRNVSWFDKDLIRIFTFVEKNKVNSVLVPKRGDLKIKNKEFHEVKAAVPTSHVGKGKDDQLEALVTIGENRFIERIVMVEDLKPGMVMANNVVSKAGMLIVRREQKLSEGLIQNIQQLQKNDSLRDDISILIPA